MAKINRFEDLQVWQNASSIAVDVFKLTGRVEQLKSDWSTKDQLRRCAFSISSNIAEGYEYDNTKDFIKFLRYSKGSAGELRSQLFVVYKAEIIDKETYDRLYKDLISISKQIGGFIKYLKGHKPPPSK